MGIPTYFRFLLEKHRDIVIEKNTYDCDYFFLDFNSILYKVLYDNEKNKIYEDVFLRNIIRELKNICNNVLKPKKNGLLFHGWTMPKSKNGSTTLQAIQICSITKTM